MHVQKVKEQEKAYNKQVFKYKGLKEQIAGELALTSLLHQHLSLPWWSNIIWLVSISLYQSLIVFSYFLQQKQLKDLKASGQSKKQAVRSLY